MATSTTRDGATSTVVNIHTENNRPYQIVATLLLCGAVGMVAFALAQNGWLEIAATLLTMFLTQLARLLISNGLIAVPKAGSSGEFQQTSGAIRTAAAEFRAWQSRSPIWRLAALAAAYTAVFMGLRWLMSEALTVFSNVWIAGAGAAFAASLIIFPSLLGSAFTKLRSRTTTAVDPAAPTTTTTEENDNA